MLFPKKNRFLILWKNISLHISYQNLAERISNSLSAAYTGLSYSKRKKVIEALTHFAVFSVKNNKICSNFNYFQVVLAV